MQEWYWIINGIVNALRKGIQRIRFFMSVLCIVMKQPTACSELDVSWVPLNQVLT